MSDIIIKNARVNNLRGIDLSLPRGKFIVLTGVSGSGKSSLAFDTLYAEGQRRYVESLSAYARQFLGRMHKPECDYIKGLPPAIAIEQRVTSRNPRSTVGTSTEIYDYLRMLFARVGHTYSPVSGAEVRRHTPDDVVRCIQQHPAGARFTILAPIVVQHGRTLMEQLKVLMQQGLSRVDRDGDIVRIEDLDEAALSEDTTLYLVIARSVVDSSRDAVTHFTDAVETAFFEGEGKCLLRFYPEGDLHTFSTRFEADGITFAEPSDNLFSFNNPVGACPECEGFGRVVGIDPDLVVPDPTLSVYDGCVVCWRGEKMGQWKDEFCRRYSPEGFPIFKPYAALSAQERDWLWHGRDGDDALCIDAFFQMLRDNQYKIQYRVMLSRYRGKTFCPTCQGTRLRREASYVKVGGKDITALVRMPIAELAAWFDALTLTEAEMARAKRLLIEIRQRLHFLLDVGLPYLTLDRLSASLSGGESQRINLATSLGSALVGSLYILDEPSIGLHPRDTERLISVLHHLRDLGNTVVVVEHDSDIMRAADLIVDIGPEAGRHGGEVVWQGAPPTAQTPAPPQSFTYDYLTGLRHIAIPSSRRSSGGKSSIRIEGARANNLRGIDVDIPIGVLTVVTGVSGSGKSTLVRDILYPALCRRLDIVSDRPAAHKALSGDLHLIKGVDFINQNPIGRSSRSNPVTYVKAYDEIRRLMAAQPLAEQLDLTPAHFSFNAEGGRCEECKGEGKVRVEMQFMADLELECEACHGQRFKKDVLDVRYHDKNICDILAMTVDEALAFFTTHGDKRVVRRLQPLHDVGLGYICLGQPSSTLSGGENQRVKLAFYLGQERTQPTLFIFDEPTTGLHLHDISHLLACFDALIERGHTIVVIEHNIDVIKTADHIIDLGPEGGEGGGTVVATGTPEQVAASGRGYTARYLACALR